MKKDAFYFPHFCNARHDRKISRLRKELGIEGYGIFFMLLEILRDQIDFKYPLDDLDLLADEFGTSEQKIRVVICNYKLFEIDDEFRFFSPKLLLYLQPYFNMKEQRKAAGIASGKARSQKQLNDRSTDVERELNENEQSKVNKSKVNKNKYMDVVELTDDEYKNLIEKFGESSTHDKIEKLSLYIKSKGAKYECHYSTILAWERNKKEQITQDFKNPYRLVD